jgi:hypothetical protein
VERSTLAPWRSLSTRDLTPTFERPVDGYLEVRGQPAGLIGRPRGARDAQTDSTKGCVVIEGRLVTESSVIDGAGRRSQKNEREYERVETPRPVCDRKAAPEGGLHDPVATNGSVKPDRRPVASRDSVRQVEQLAILALALIFGVIGFAVHFFWFPAIVLMAALFGLIASGLRGTRGGVFSEVVSTVVTETRSIAEATAHDADRPPSDQP